MFDCHKNPNTGTFICEVHLKLADKDKRICDNEVYTLPKKVRHWHLLILPSRGMLLYTTKPFVGISDNIPAHRHTPKHSFICLTSAQGHNQPTPRVQTWQGWTLKDNWRTWKWPKKIGRRTKKSRWKNTFLMKKNWRYCKCNCYHKRNFFGYQRQDLKWYGVSMVCKTNSVVVKMKM